jgi:hypothetical protein
MGKKSYWRWISKAQFKKGLRRGDPSLCIALKSKVLDSLTRPSGYDMQRAGQTS